MSSGVTDITIGVLYPGEMGAALASLLASRGVRVVTTLGGRGKGTMARCQEAGIAVLPTLADVVREAGVVISVVPPAAAEDMAAAYCELAHLAPARAIYLDLNSIGPELAKVIGGRIEAAGRAFVDGAINGLAKNLTRSATLFLSGARAGDVAAVIGDGMRVQVLGDEPGRASAMKMLLSGLSKGLCALFVESALVARRQGMLGEMIEAYEKIYPGVMSIVERMLPTYAQHAARRAVEMRETEQTAEAAGVEPCVLSAVRQVHEMIAGAMEDAQGEMSVEKVIEWLDERGRLRANVLGDVSGGGVAGRH